LERRALALMHSRLGTNITPRCAWQFEIAKALAPTEEDEPNLRAAVAFRKQLGAENRSLLSDTNLTELHARTAGQRLTTTWAADSPMTRTTAPFDFWTKQNRHQHGEFALEFTRQRKPWLFRALARQVQRRFGSLPAGRIREETVIWNLRPPKEKVFLGNRAYRRFHQAWCEKSRAIAIQRGSEQPGDKRIGNHFRRVRLLSE